MKKLSIVVPCYNEAENIPSLLEAYQETLKNYEIEVVLVNNGSTDNTADVLVEISSKFSDFLKVVNVPVNQGYGYGILEGLRNSSTEFIGWTHGDLQTPPKDVVKAFDILEKSNFNKNLYVKGSRTGRPIFDQFFSVGMGIFESLYLGTKLSEVNAQPNIFHRSFYENWKNPPHDFALDLYALYQARKSNLRLIRFPVPFLKRQHGVSKWNTGILAKWKFIKRTIIFSIELKKSLKDR